MGDIQRKPQSHSPLFVKIGETLLSNSPASNGPCIMLLNRAAYKALEKQIKLLIELIFI